MFLSKNKSTDICKVKETNGAVKKTSANDFLPLKSVKIYLDIINNNGMLQKVTEEVKSLGGTIETFLNKGVSYFVTNRHVGKKAQDNNSESYLIGTPSSSRSSVLTADSPRLFEASTTKINKVAKSRADILLERAQKLNKCAEDVFQMASQWGIKIVHVLKFTQWVKKLKMLRKNRVAEDTAKRISKFKLSSHLSKTLLVVPYFKFEDVEGQYCPRYCKLQEWPTIDFTYHEQSPFRKINASLKNISVKNSPQNDCASPKNFKVLMNTSSKIKKYSVGDKPGYCDICSVHYINVYKHIVEKKHQELVSTPKFYTTLDTFISSLPTLKQLQEKYYCSQKDNCNTRSNSVQNTITDTLTVSKPEQLQGNYIGDNYTACKKAKLDLEFNNLENIGQNFTENKENDRIGTSQCNKKNVGLSFKNILMEKEQCNLKRNAFQQLQNMTPQREGQTVIQTTTVKEVDILCTPKSNPTRLLRSTSQRRSMSMSLTEHSGNSPTANFQNNVPPDVMDKLPSENSISLGVFPEPLDLTVKFPVENISFISESFKAADSKFDTSNCNKSLFVDFSALDEPDENLAKSLELAHLVIEDTNWNIMRADSIADNRVAPESFIFNEKTDEPMFLLT